MRWALEPPPGYNTKLLQQHFQPELGLLEIAAAIKGLGGQQLMDRLLIDNKPRLNYVDCVSFQQLSRWLEEACSTDDGHAHWGPLPVYTLLYLDGSSPRFSDTCSRCGAVCCRGAPLDQRHQSFLVPLSSCVGR